jgi:hypothetical protein
MMDKASFENLIAGKPDEIRKKGILLFNGAAKSAMEYQQAPTASNLRNWESAQAAMDKFETQMKNGEEQSDTFETIADVLDYLIQSGWKVTKTSLYRHQKEGKILPGPDGTYRQKDADKYARTFLKQKSTGKRIDDKMDEMQRRKLELELQNLELERKRKSFAFDRDQEKYVPKEQMELELAARAGVLDAGLKHWVQSRAAEWIRAVAGDMKKVGDLINLMNHDLDEHINSYASAVDYEVVIDEEPHGDGEDIEDDHESIS